MVVPLLQFVELVLDSLVLGLVAVSFGLDDGDLLLELAHVVPHVPDVDLQFTDVFVLVKALLLEMGDLVLELVVMMFNLYKNCLLYTSDAADE